MPKEAFVIHKEGMSDSILVSASGRILTEPMDMPEWATNGLALAMLAERTQFYQTRLGTELAAPIVGTNIIAYDDLSFVAVDEEGEELTIEANEEYRQGVLATALGVNREEGEIERVITEHYIDREGQVYTAEEIVSKMEADEAVQKKAATG